MSYAHIYGQVLAAYCDLLMCVMCMHVMGHLTCITYTMIHPELLLAIRHERSKLLFQPVPKTRLNMMAPMCAEFAHAVSL